MPRTAKDYTPNAGIMHDQMYRLMQTASYTEVATCSKLAACDTIEQHRMAAHAVLLALG